MIQLSASIVFLEVRLSKENKILLMTYQIKYTATNIIGTMRRIRTIPTMSPMFVEAPGGSAGLTAAAKKNERKITII